MERVEIIGYEWRWLRPSTSIVDACEAYIVIPTSYRHLVLHRVEMYHGDNNGGIRYTPVKQGEIPEGEV